MTHSVEYGGAENHQIHRSFGETTVATMTVAPPMLLFYTNYLPHTQRIALSCGAFNNRDFSEALPLLISSAGASLWLNSDRCKPGGLLILLAGYVYVPGKEPPPIHRRRC